MANEAVEKAKRTSLINTSEAAQLQQLEEAESCPTCGGPMQAMPREESEMGPEQGGRHGMMAKMTGTDFPGYRMRQLKKGEKISGG